MTANTYGRQVVVPLVNKSGGSVAAGDVVVVDTSNNDAFTTSTAGAVTGTVGIAQETIANNAIGRVLLSGYAALVNTSASVTRGNFGKTHTVAKQAVDAGASRVAGTFCQFLTGGTTPDAIVWPTDLGAAGGSTAAVGVSVYATGTQSIPNATGPVLLFDAENFDTDGFHSTVTNTSRLTVPAGKDGKYIIGGGTFFASSGGGTYRILAITKNGAAVPPHMRRGVAPADPALALSGIVLDLVATDFIEIIAYQDSGGPLNVGHASTAEFKSTLSMMRLGS